MTLSCWNHCSSLVRRPNGVQNFLSTTIGNAMSSPWQSVRLHPRTRMNRWYRVSKRFPTLEMLLNVMAAVKRPLADLYPKTLYSCCLGGLRGESTLHSWTKNTVLRDYKSRIIGPMNRSFAIPWCSYFIGIMFNLECINHSTNMKLHQVFINYLRVVLPMLT